MRMAAPARIWVTAKATRRKSRFPKVRRHRWETQWLSPNGKLLLVSHQGAQHPDNIWVYDIREHHSRQLTFLGRCSLNPFSPPSHPVHYKSLNGKIISAILWMPFNLKRDGTNPGIVLAPGGPTDQTVDRFNPSAAALTSARIHRHRAEHPRAPRAMASNSRRRIIRTWAERISRAKCMQQICGRDGLCECKKLGITGGSYGGFMTLMALGKTPDIVAVGVEQYGVVNWYTMLQHSDPFLQAYIRGILGDPEKDRAVYDAASPFKYLQNAKAPLLVLQGENDVRVPKEEAEQVVEIYKSRNLAVDEKIYPREGHGYARRENQLDALERMVTWFDRFLKPSASSNSTANGTGAKN